ncbi:DNA ligase D [Piscinibacter sp. XHJ-5]|uniref:DNA ligase D n=1 Tax=Piscinibacter sp. XHJ-5 TaxID=3037797 RepID=UPI0024535120|nr:DNA ligase D [Piscinibacter sp. XHJ-5]
MSDRPSARGDPLKRYSEKRNFSITAEPPARKARSRPKALSFVVQKHWASRLHYDFRLELDGVLVSWAVPKGPSVDPKERRMAIHVEDHPVSYGGFEGTIPPRQYGAGTVIVWDRGTWEPVGDPHVGLRDGKLVFRLHGQKLAGEWELVRTSKPGERKQEQWMLFKKRDAWARPLAEYDVIAALPDSVVEQPLGLIEEREPRTSAAPAAHRASDEPDLANAVKASLPRTLSPQLATLVDAAPSEAGWIAESKFDGYRLLCRIERGKARLITRNGLDWTDKMPSLAEALQQLGIDRAWLDGEIVVLNRDGVPDFNALQNAMDSRRSESVVYYLFDAPFVGEYDLRRVPLWSRKRVLERLLEGDVPERVRFSDSFNAPGGQLLHAACQLGLEGVILKQENAPYVGERSKTWLKLKCGIRQEFVVGGFTDRSGAKSEVGGLLLGYPERGRLRYAGSVGTGWGSRTGKELHRLLVPLEVSTPPFDEPVKPGRWSRRAKGSERWVRPEVVVEVSFSEWTPDGHVRHPSFKGVRSDKPPKQITREPVVAAPAAAASTPSAKRSSVKLSNPERIIDPSTGLKKVDLFRYYESVAEWILPHLENRPVMLVRAPEGLQGKLFFQRHPETPIPLLRVLDASVWPGHEPMFSIETSQALLSAVQMNAVELHDWNYTATQVDKPDRVIFDMDPGEGVPFSRVIEAALVTKAFLEDLGLKSWLKTSGGNGLHVVVPLTPKAGTQEVLAFAKAVVEHMARAIPSRFVAKTGARNRVGRIFIDYIRNAEGATTACAFSARARPGMGVSMPVAWDEIQSLKSGAQWTIATAREHLSFRKVDPWRDYWRERQLLTAAVKQLRSARAR